MNRRNCRNFGALLQQETQFEAHDQQGSTSTEPQRVYPSISIPKMDASVRLMEGTEFLCVVKYFNPVRHK